MKKGFTLIELLVVIAIIALLLAILMPSLAKVKMKARSIVCMSNMKQQSLIFTLYTNDNDGRYPARNNSWPHYVKVGAFVDTRVALEPYVEDPYVTICPAVASYKMDAGDILKEPEATWMGYGGWETLDEPSVSIIALGYMWFFNFDDDDTTVTYLSGERPWPNRQSDGRSTNVLAAHQLVYYSNGPGGIYYSDWGHEASSKGRIYEDRGDHADDAFTSESAPVMYGDGSVISVVDSQFKKRAQIGTYIYYY